MVRLVFFRFIYILELFGIFEKYNDKKLCFKLERIGYGI